MLSQYPYKTQADQSERLLPRSLENRLRGSMARAYGIGLLVVLAAIWASLISWSAADPSLTHVTRQPPANIMGYPGAMLSDLLLESLGLTSILALLAPMLWGVELTLAGRIRDLRAKLTFFPLSIFLLGSAFASLPVPEIWPLSQGLGGILGDAIYGLCHLIIATLVSPTVAPLCGAALFASGCAALAYSVGLELKDIARAARSVLAILTPAPAVAAYSPGVTVDDRQEPSFSTEPFSGQDPEPELSEEAEPFAGAPAGPAAAKPSTRSRRASPDSDEPTLLRSSEGSKRSEVEPEQEADLPPSLRPQFAARRQQKPEPAPHFDPVDDPADPLAGRDRSFDLDTDDDSAAIARRFAPANSKGAGYAASVEPPKTGSDWVPKKSPAPKAPAPFDRNTIVVGVEIEAPTAKAASVKATAPAAARATVAPARKLMQSRQPQPASDVHAADPRAEFHAAQAPWEAAVPTVTPSPITDPAADSRPDDAARKRRLGTLGYRPTARAGYKRPSTHLLEPVPASRPGPEFTRTVIRAHTRMLKDVLTDFGIKGEVREIKQGPVVTLYELEPQRGTKTSRVIALADDIARAMSVSTARIAAQPGRGTIGIELPNVRRETVSLRDILEADAYRRCDGVLPLALGKSIEGTRIVSDLSRFPHLLVVGAPGSGKSVLLNAMIQSLIYRHGPDTCRLLLIDPNMIELSNYNDIPHLLAPAVTDPHKALAALNWVVAEMEERHKRMSKLAVRNIEIFNNRVNNAKKRGEMIARTVNTGFDRQTGEPIYEYEQMDLKPMPYIVVVVDEFAGMMRIAGTDVETAVRRMAATAQAAGIHLIMATQDLSPDTLTEPLSKSLRSKVCFKTASKAESRSVLGAPGAEQLLDHGDLLLSSGAGQCARVHTAHIGPSEIESIVEFLRAAGPADYDTGLVELVTGTEPPSEQQAPPADHYARAIGPRIAGSRPRLRRLFAQPAGE